MNLVPLVGGGKGVAVVADGVLVAFELDAGVARVVPGVEQVGPQLERLRVALDRLPEPPQAHERVAEVVPGFDHSGVGLEGLPIGANRGLGVVALLVGAADAEPDLGGGRSRLDRARVAGEGVGDVALFLAGVGEAAPRRGRIRILFDRLPPEPHGGGGVPLEQLLQAPLVEPGAGRRIFGLLGASRLQLHGVDSRMRPGDAPFRGPSLSVVHLHPPQDRIGPRQKAVRTTL